MNNFAELPASSSPTTTEATAPLEATFLPEVTTTPPVNVITPSAETSTTTTTTTVTRPPIRKSKVDTLGSIIPAQIIVAPNEITPPSEACLSQGLWVLNNETFADRNDKRCSDYVDGLFNNVLPKSNLYQHLVSIAGQQAKTTAFQKGAGIPTTNYADAITVQTMAQEAKRLSSSTESVVCNSKNIANPKWSRAELVDWLARRGGFLVKFDVAAPRTDILDPSEFTDEAVVALSGLTMHSICNGYGFNVLIANTGHDPITINGNKSEHDVGLAYDTRPMNGFKPMPSWNGDPNTPILPEQHITSHPEALATANKMMDYYGSSPANYSEIIWSDSPFAIDDGKVIPGNHNWGYALESSHPTHIHAGVRKKPHDS